MGARARGRANAAAVGEQIGEAIGCVRIVLPLRIDVPPLTTVNRSQLSNSKMF